MGQYSITFAGETTGAAPVGFTARWTTTGQTWAVRAAAADLGGKRLEHTRTTTARRAYSWDTPGSAADAEILVRWRSTSNATDQIWLTLRGSGAAATEGGYVFRNTSSSSIRIEKYISGTGTLIGSAATYQIAANKWYWVRFRVNGTTQKIKIWDGDIEPEPSAWTIERTDSAITAAGWAAVGNAAATGTRDYDELAVGTAGDSAIFTPAAAEVRLTQAHALVVGQSPADVRLTQAHALVVCQPVPDVYLTQAFVLVVCQQFSPSEIGLHNGTIMSVSSSQPAQYTAAGFAALSWDDVGEVTDIGELSKVFEIVAQNLLNLEYARKFKGISDMPDVSMTVARKWDDAGQVLLMSALASMSAHSFRFLHSGGEKIYVSGHVMRAFFEASESDTMHNIAISMALDPSTLVISS